MAHTIIKVSIWTKGNKRDAITRVLLNSKTAHMTFDQMEKALEGYKKLLALDGWFLLSPSNQLYESLSGSELLEIHLLWEGIE